MGILTWILVGVVAGWLAGRVTKGSGFGLVGDMILGVVGALVGGWLAAVLFNAPNAINGFNISTIFVAFLGAVVVLFITGMVRNRQTI
jgi:uncharacterized membrane protein YeaQ/YmgE (transglycosylase-associated protein family)